MVKAARGDVKSAKKATDGMKRKMGGRKVRVQKKGELDLSNPIIPAELDEDIDDDLAFNSDDEAKFGAFFSSNKKPAKSSSKKSSNKKGEQEDMEDEFDRLKSVGGDGDHGTGDEDYGFSDDSRDEFDLSEMLDSKEERKAKKDSRRGEKTKRRRVEDKLTNESESILGPTWDEGKTANVKELLKSTASTAGKKRLESALQNNKNLLTEETDEYEDEKATRQQTREAVTSKLKKYGSLLRTHAEQPHLHFPLASKNVTAEPGSMGSVISGITAKLDKQPAEDSLRSRMAKVLSAGGLANIAKAQKQPSQDGNIAFHEDGDNQGDDDGDDEVGEGGQSHITSNYMAKLKAMLSYEIAKRKRFNKIKSKTYRRILRKEKERDQERKQRALELLDPEAARERLQRKMDRMRAEERATQKHKNTSKWVRRSKKFAQFDTNVADALHEQHALHSKLMEKMDEDAAADWEQAAGDVSSSEEEEQRVDELLAGKKPASSILWGEEGQEAEAQTPTEKARKELLDMKFMKTARERSDKQLKEELQDLEEDIRAYHEDGAVKPKSKKQGKAATDAAGAEAGKKSFAGSKTAEPKLKARRGLNAEERDDAEQVFDEEEVSPNGDPADLSGFVGDRARRIVKREPVVSTRVRVLPGAQKRAREEVQPALDDEMRDQLVARAFAQDDVDEDFLKLKSDQVESVMKPEDRNAALPGWGEWGGEDNRLGKRQKEKVDKMQLERRIKKQTLMKSRADAQLDNVIINHDVDLVADRFTLHMVPRPFSNAQEFSRSLRQPLGPEWNTSLGFKEGNQPRITTVQGVAIEPLDLTNQKKKAKTTRRK